MGRQTEEATKAQQAEAALKDAGAVNVKESSSSEREIFGSLRNEDSATIGYVDNTDLPEGWGITDVHHTIRGHVYVGVGPV